MKKHFCHESRRECNRDVESSEDFFLSNIERVLGRAIFARGMNGEE